VVWALLDGFDDGIEDEFAAAASYEPIVGQGDAESGGMGRWVYHDASTVSRGSRVIMECESWSIKEMQIREIQGL